MMKVVRGCFRVEKKMIEFDGVNCRYKIINPERVVGAEGFEDAFIVF